MCDQKSGKICSLLGMKIKSNFAPKRLILHIKFPKFSRCVTPAPVLWKGAPSPHATSSTALAVRGGSSTPVRHRSWFDPPLSNTFRGLYGSRTQSEVLRMLYFTFLYPRIGLIFTDVTYDGTHLNFSLNAKKCNRLLSVLYCAMYTH